MKETIAEIHIIWYNLRYEFFLCKEGEAIVEKCRFSEEELCRLERVRIPMAVCQYLDDRIVILALTDGFCDLFGFTNRASAYGETDSRMFQSIHPDDLVRVCEAISRFFKEGGTYETVYRARARNGSDFRMIHAMGEFVTAESGVRLAYIWYTDEGPYRLLADSSCTELSRAFHSILHEESAILASKYDYLTGLSSMTRFFEIGSSRADAISASGGNPALVFLDLHGMKYFNRRNGFAAGDKLLQGVARILAHYFGSENCSRLGQDHFAVISREQGLDPILQQVFDACAALQSGLTLPVHAGIYLLHTEKVDISTACDRAKIACDAMRGRYTSCSNYYNLSMRDSEDLQQYIIANLNTAFQEKWVQVFYQPIVRAVSGKVCHEEALARWMDPSKGMLSPADFIPSLEDAGLIYKLDLYVVDQVLEKLKHLSETGQPRVPQSVNLSRSDFDACDMVEEIRARVDASGQPRELICIEITESVIGKDFEFMKAQIQRFQQFGFSIWMDDFGSGYSSLDALESISFDLIKFDMHFMRKFDQGDNSKIILTQLVRMAADMGVDTVCEGVENRDQLDFLKEIGCAKLQGFFFSKPLPPEDIWERIRTGILVGYENPEEGPYFEAIGRANLFDMTLSTNGEPKNFRGYFQTLPMGIMEYQNGSVRFIRSNHSFRKYLHHFYNINISDAEPEFNRAHFGGDELLLEQIRTRSEQHSQMYFNTTLPDGSTAHSTMRWIGTDPVTGCTAVALVILSITPPDCSVNYANIARALAADYFRLYYVNLKTEEFIEYSSGVGSHNLAEERHGTDFFNSARLDARIFLYSEDQAAFLEAFTKENILLQLARQGVFTISYRMMTGYDPVYMSMKIMRMDGDENYIIIGISSIDAQMKEKERLERIREKELSDARLRAVSSKYICLYSVDLATGHYTQYSTNSDYEELRLSKIGTDFFFDALANGSRLVLPEDFPGYREQMQEENILQKIRACGLFTFDYRLMLNGEPQQVHLQASLVNESNGQKLIVGVSKAD